MDQDESVLARDRWVRCVTRVRRAPRARHSPATTHLPQPPLRSPTLDLTRCVACSTTAAYTLVRGTGDTRGVSGMIKPLAIVGLPAAAYAAYYRSMPPQAVRFGLYSCVLLHVYDRIWKPHGAMMENMPTTKLHRRIW
ncbi:hypothetical protein EON67_08670 [archaeon]|nr:MAG: hypothetical protein EON67_08670 [archaeon]